MRKKNQFNIFLDVPYLNMYGVLVLFWELTVHLNLLGSMIFEFYSWFLRGETVPHGWPRWYLLGDREKSETMDTMKTKLSNLLPRLSTSGQGCRNQRISTFEKGKPCCMRWCCISIQDRKCLSSTMQARCWTNKVRPDS